MLLIAGVAVSSAQTDTTFWFVAPEVANSHGDRPVAFRVTSQGQAATVTLSMPANPSFTPVTWNVPANGTRSVIYGNTDTINLIENKPHNTQLNKGFLIESSTPITAYYEVVTAGNNPDIFALKGRNGLGTDFLVPSQDDMANAHGHERIDIVATENNTQIQIIPTAALDGVNTDTVFITLNRGETYSVRANSTANNQSLRGTQIKSNKKIAVTIIDDSVRGGDIFGGGGCFDLLGDQLIPTNIVGNDYIAIRGFLNLNPGIREKVYILAKDNNTQIFINNVSVTTLQARQTHEATFTTDEMFISSVGGPVYVMHISGFGCETGMAILPPISCTGSTQVGFTRTTNEFFGLYVFTEAGNQGNLVLNGNNTLLQASDFDTVPNSSNAWVYTRKEFTTGQIPVNSGNLLVSSSGKFHMGIINGGATSGCRYGFFSDFARYTIETSTNSSSDNPICEGDTLRVWADSIVGATQYTWNTPLGVVTSREIVIPSLSSANVGMYRAFAIVDGCQSEEDTIYVGMKPLPGDPDARNSGPYCVGDTIRLQADSINNASYAWTGPNNFSSNLRNPTVPNATVTDSGTYQLRVTLDGCTGDVHTTQVSVFPIPSQPNASAVDAALCPGDTLRLQVDSVAGASFQWTGPDGFSSSLRNPVIPGISAAKAGNYLARITINGCTSIADTVLVSLLPGPLAIAVLSGNVNSCAGDTVALRISPAFGNSYQWFRNGVAIRPGGVNDTLLLVTTTGSYQVEATSVFGCTDTAAAVQITVNSPANVTITPNLLPPTICQGDSINLQVQHVVGYSYQWFLNNDSIPGATDSLIRIGQAGQYTISITDSNGCVSNSSTPTSVQVIQPPVAQITPAGTQQICSGSNTILHANVDTFATYSWLRNGQLLPAATDSTLRVDSAGLYQLILSYASGCTDTSAATEILLLPKPTANIAHSFDTILCGGDSIRLAAPATANLSYRWFRNNSLIVGAIDSIFFASQNGSYQVEITNSSGCRDTSAAVALISSNINPPLPIGGNTRQLCAGDSITLVMQSQHNGLLQWFRNGALIPSATDSQLVVFQAGQYLLQLTDTLGCSQMSDTIEVSFLAQPTAQVTPSGPTTFCLGDSLLLSAHTAGINQFSWLRNGVGIPGANDSTLLVNDSAAYQLIVVNSQGCRDTSVLTNTFHFAQPTATIQLVGDSILCREDTARLFGPATGNLSYRWFRDGNVILGATDSILLTQTSGAYRLEVTNLSGCRDTSSSINLLFQTPAAPSRNGAALRQLCQGDSITLSMNPNGPGQLQWFRNGTSIAAATDSTLNVAQPGQYVLRITDSLGCIRFGDTIEVSFFPQPTAQVTPSGPTTFCLGDSLLLSANTAGITQFSWLRNGVGIPGANDSTLLVNDSAAYQLIVVNSQGCRDTSVVTNTFHFAQPTATIQLAGDSILCREDTARLSGPATGNLSYRWFRDGNVILGATDSILLTQTSGAYRLEVTNLSGCRDTSTSINLLFQTPAAPSRNGAALRLLCEGDSITLSMNPNGPGQLQWFRNGNSINSATDSTISVSQPGQYVLRVTDSLSCVRFGDTVEVSFFPQPVANITPQGATTLCAGTQLVLQANILANHNYQWLLNGVIIPNANNTSFTVSASGAYRVIVTNPNGCVDTASAINVLVNPLPLVTISAGRTIACAGDTIMLRATQATGYVYQWLRNGIALPNAQDDSMITTQAGQYAVVVTDTNNCTAVSQQLTLNQHPPANTQVQLLGNLNFCSGDSLRLQLTPTAGASYQWYRNGNLLPNDTSTQLVISAPGNYQVAITSPQGCVDSSVAFPVTVFPLPTANLQSPASDSLCVGDSLQLQALNSSGLSLQWLRNGAVIAGQTGATLTVLQAGNYQLVVTNANNCRDSSQQINIRMRPQPLATLVLNGPAQFCQGESSILRGPLSANLQYQWFRNGVLLPNTTDSLLVSNSGQYILRVIDAAGCSDTAAGIQITVDSLPIANIQPSGSISFCPGGQQLLQAPIQAGMSYLWFRNGLQLPGTGNPSITVSQAGSYQLVVVNPITGCRDSSAITQVQLLAEPSVSIVTNDPTQRCSGETVSLQANSPDGNLSLQWLRNGATINGANLPNFIAVQSGNYQVVAINPQGCSDTSNTISINILSRPTATVIQPGPFFLCFGETLTLQVPVQPGVNYQWFNLGVAIPGETNPSLVVTATGIYSCTVTSGNGCGSLSQDVEVTFRIRPEPVQTSSNSPICNGNDIELTATPSPGNTYVWRGPNNFSSSQQNPTITNASLRNMGWYYCYVVLSGCSSRLDSVYVHVEPPLPTFSIKGRTRLCTGNPLELEVDDLLGGSYNWTTPSGQQFNGRIFRIEESWLTDSGTYTIDLNVNDCPAPPQGVKVTVNDHNFYFPTAFTPNGDGLNDVFKPATFYEGAYDLRVYDRWGALVFQSNDPQAHWDGSVFGGPGESSAYNYVLFYEGCVREKEVISGTVLLLR